MSLYVYIIRVLIDIMVSLNSVRLSTLKNVGRYEMNGKKVYCFHSQRS